MPLSGSGTEQYKWIFPVRSAQPRLVSEKRGQKMQQRSQFTRSNWTASLKFLQVEDTARF
jgi:hypothetical protein